MGRYSSFLFAQPSFLEGAGRVIDLGTTMVNYNISPTTEMADALAFRADRMALAVDTSEALRKFADQIEARARIPDR